VSDKVLPLTFALASDTAFAQYRFAQPPICVINFSEITLNLQFTNYTLIIEHLDIQVVNEINLSFVAVNR